MNPDQLPIKPGLLFSSRRALLGLFFLIIIVFILFFIFFFYYNRVPVDRGATSVVDTSSEQHLSSDTSSNTNLSNGPSTAVTSSASPTNDNFVWNGGSDRKLPDYKEHYMYTQTSTGKDHPVELYYDGKKIDSAWGISDLRLFGDHYAYHKTDKYPNYDLVFDGKNLGQADYPVMWAGNIAYTTRDEITRNNVIHYNGDVLTNNCKDQKYDLWGNNIAYSCDTDQGTEVYFNKTHVGIGNIVSLHKDFLLVNKVDDTTSDLCFVLYKKGKKVDGFWPKNNGRCPGSIAAYGDSIGVFGDNYWIIKDTGTSKDNEPIYDIDYNGKKVFTTTYPKTVLFGDTFIYGNYYEVYQNGNKIHSGNDIFSGDVLFGNNYFSTLGMRNKAFYNGKALNGIDLSGELYSRLFGDMYLTWSADSIYKNGLKIDAGAFDTIMALGDNYSYVRQVKKDSGAVVGQLMFNGAVVADNFNSVDFKAISGKNIYYKVSSSGGNDYLYYRNANILGSKYGKADSKIILDWAIWPMMEPDTELGTNSANSNDAFYDTSSTGVIGKHTFTDEWLYLTDQWK